MSGLRRIELAALEPSALEALFDRSAVPDPDVRDGAASICRDVARRGDVAVAEAASRFGGGFRRVSDEELDAAVDTLTTDVRTALGEAIANVTAYHTAQPTDDLVVTPVDGVTITRRWTPLRRVGCYVPGGKATYPSTVIMTVVPARVAGVPEIVVVSPGDDATGAVDPVFLAACRLAGATEVWTMGGAQAIGALAYGTESVSRVQKIVGPGNAWVTAAKLAVFGRCAIDLPAGPSEVLVLADETSDPRLLAVDLLCQAEHGPDSPAVLVSTDEATLDAVDVELRNLLPTLDRSGILDKALTDHGWSVLAADHDSAIDFANRYAGEHVSIMTADPDADAARITAAGSVYVGRWSPESAGDYATGANHVLPTGGLAAACGPLDVDEFGSWRQEQRLDETGLSRLVQTITTLASAEGLTAHALAATLRFERGDDE